MAAAETFWLFTLFRTICQEKGRRGRREPVGLDQTALGLRAGKICFKISLGTGEIDWSLFFYTSRRANAGYLRNLPLTA